MLMWLRSAEARWIAAVVIVVFGLWVWILRDHVPTETWSGVDEVVIDRWATAAGRPPSAPVLEWLTGDILLFAFLVAGLTAGFAFGWVARSLFGAAGSKQGAR